MFDYADFADLAKTLYILKDDFAKAEDAGRQTNCDAFGIISSRSQPRSVGTNLTSIRARFGDCVIGLGDHGIRFVGGR